MTGIWGVIGTVLLLLLLFLLIAVGIWWLRTRMDKPARSFRATLRQMEKEIGAGDRYQTPWVLLVGDDAGVAASLCQNWRLIAEGKRRWFGQWWYGSDGAVLVTPADMFGHAEGAVPQLSAWRRLLGVLLRVRANRPLDAVIWTVPAEKLWSGESASTAGLAAYRKFADLQQRLGLSLPVYLVVTGTESVPGMLEFAQNLPDEAQDIMLGWSSPFAVGMGWRSDWADMAVDHLSATLAEEITELGSLAGGVGESLYLLPRQFDAIRGNLQALCDPVFRGNALGEAPCFRGVYFVGAWSVDATGKDAFSVAEAPAINASPLFVSRLLRQRVLAETGLAQPVPRILALRRRSHRIVEISAAVLAAVWFAGMVWVWHGERNDAATLSSLLRSVKDERGNGRQALTSDDAAAQTVTNWWRVISDVPRWQFATAVFPTSLLSGVDGRIDTVITGTTHNSLFLPLQFALHRNMEALRVMGVNTEEQQGKDTDAPDTWPRYVRSRQLVDDAAQLEHSVDAYNRALTTSATPMDDATELANTLFKLDMRSGKLAAHDYLNRLLAGVSGRIANPLDLTSIQHDTATHFSTLMQGWLDRLYADETFGVTAGAIQKQLNNLRSGQSASAVDMNQLDERIDLLRRLVAATDSAWNRNGSQDLVPGYAAMMNTARHSRLIGVQTVTDVTQHADHVRDAFKTRWINDDGPDVGVLQQSNGAIRISDEVNKLDTALELLLNQDFMANLLANHQVTSNKNLTADGVDADSLSASLSYYASYRKYFEQSTQSVPETYRAAMIAAAQACTAQSMWDVLVGHVHETDAVASDTALTFDALARKASETASAFETLDRHDLAIALTEQINRMAMFALKKADASLTQMAPYEPLHGTFSWWDGGKNASLRAWRVSSPQDLQQYLDGQAQALANLSASVTPAIAWLDGHADQLRAGESQQVARWKNLAQELQKYKEKNSTSAPALIEHLISKDLNEMDITTCTGVLGNAGLPTGENEFASRARYLVRIASDRCTGLRTQAAATAWEKVSSYFSQYLAGRFPFADSLAAPEADPARVGGMMRLLDENQSAIQAGLDDVETLTAPAARSFMRRMQQGRVWLGPLLLRDASGVQGLDVEVDWRTDRSEEQGADQVIEWSLMAGNQVIRYPGADKNRLHWAVGQPVASGLRWAKDGLQAPQDDPFQTAFAVVDRQARWSYGNDWALLRWIRDHIAPAQLTEADDGGTPLMFAVPLSAVPGKASGAHMFMRVTLLAAGGKTPVMLSALPTRAPASPFRAVTLPDVKPLIQAQAQ